MRDSMPGWRRVRRGRSFAYVDSDGRRLSDPQALQRIRRLAIPPAYREVWICPLANGHLQATGRDARGRKQYRYHPAWQAWRGATKFERLLAFGRALPALRRRVRRDLARRGLSRERVLAAMVRLLDTAYLRIGNREYARANRSYGLTTLRSDHARVTGRALELRFRGKGGVQHAVRVDDERLARIVRRCQHLPGQPLFQYVDADGEPRSIGSTDVNAYLRDAMHGDFTAKDFRTWHASALALDRLCRLPPPRGRRDAQRCVRDVIAAVARRLGHTVTVCRQAYVHAAVIEAYRRGALEAAPVGQRGLHAREARLLALLAAGAAVTPDRAAPPGR